VSRQSAAPSVHAISTSIANFIFGAPWVGEAVKIGQASKDAKPVDPNGNPDPPASAPPAPTSTSGFVKPLGTVGDSQGSQTP